MDTEKLILEGTPASTGIAEGLVRIVVDHRDTASFEEGSVLVAEMTEPPMVMMMNRAAAIVTNHGGITSHPAIVSRELGVPCVVGTKTATTTLKNGMRVRVDGTAGKVYLLSDT